MTNTYSHALKIASKNNMKVRAADGVDVSEHLTTFVFRGTAIHDPFVSECGRFEVDPIDYYGMAFLTSRFFKEDI
jgi:hypothetical protein